MSSEFDPNVFIFQDRAGQGRWEIGHYRQHVRYNQVLASFATPVIIPIQPLMTMGNTDLERRIFLNSHENLHEAIRPYANVTGIDLSLVDFEDEEEFYSWMDVHAQEHALIDAAFGLA